MRLHTIAKNILMHQLSVWEKESFFSPRDIIIAGSGFVGLWTAYFLKKIQPKLNIAIIERGIIPTGASTRNAGFACFGSVTELMADTKKMGEEKMLELVEWRFKGLSRIRKIFRDKEIGYENEGGYELIMPSQQIDINSLRSGLDNFNRKLRKIVNKNKSFLLADAKIKQMGFSGVQHLVENKLEGQLHSGKLCSCLLQLVQSQGVTVLNNIEITSFEKGKRGLILHTNRDVDLSASKLLVCTNAFAKQLLPDLDLEPARGQVLVTAPLSKLRFKGTFHFDEGFYYFRNLGNRILLGGARNKALDEERTATMATTDFIQGELENFLREIIIPGLKYHVDYRWSGIMGIGSEKMPIVKKINEHLFCAVRMSGMGVALAPEVGRKLAADMLS